MTKYVYLFSEGNASMRELLGGKGANLAEMTGLGMPVPRGFTITTEACMRYYEDNETIAPEIEKEIFDTLAFVENKIGKKLGDPTNPYLVSVRSGARASMPGMMDTILNLGLNDEVVLGLGKLTGNPRFANDSYRRFITMFADVVMGIDKNNFEAEMDAVKEAVGAKLDTDLNADNMIEVVDRFKKTYKRLKGEDFPQDPKVQLMEAVKAVFRSWNNERAIVYRRLNNIPSSWGTAVNIQEMVYGNMGETSGTGVAFTRNPATGENKLYGEFLMNAQGEDVVAGIRTPVDIQKLHEVMPEVYDQFQKIAHDLEKHYFDMQDMEFTIERGKLFMLQTRNGKRTAAAALKIAVDMVKEGLISKEEALLKIEPKSLDALLHPGFDSEALKAATPIAKGLPASPGSACGKIFFEAKELSEFVQATGEKAVLVRLETSPEDIEGMVYAQGILTGRGGMTSHAAVVARGMGKCCVSGCSEVIINEKDHYLVDKNGRRYNKGDWMAFDGSTGYVYGEQIPTTEAKISGDFEIIMGWADEIRRLKVLANADSGKDAKTARSLGAQGIGLTRTEHMFFGEDRIFAFRKMIVSETLEAREKALAELLPIQRQDFYEIFKAMEGCPVTIRLLDPPLHEFLPTEPSEIEHLAKSLNMETAHLTDLINRLHEMNPMMGHRGCRLAVSYPEIAAMQTRAIIEAALKVQAEGLKVIPEIMVPLVFDLKELKFVKNIISSTAETIFNETGKSVKYEVGTMIEIPRAALLADEIAQEAEFFSFGTNDLTQMTFGLSRDDAGRILDDYYNAKILEIDPTASLDQRGVGQLIQMATERGRATRPGMNIGICGEHGGDPASIDFCHRTGLTYVSCSPFRVPIARLAAAQAAIKNK